MLMVTYVMAQLYHSMYKDSIWSVSIDRLTQHSIFNFFRTFAHWNWDSNYISCRAVYVHDDSETELEKTTFFTNIGLMPVLSPLPPHRTVTNCMMSSSALKKIDNEFKYGWNQIQLTLSKYLSSTGSILNSAKLTRETEVWRSFFFHSSLFNWAEKYLLVEFRTSQLKEFKLNQVEMQSRHNAMVGLVEARLS